ncbi:MAG: prephenate dehydrogenase/arogenate dehydrogenase family protein [Anaerolineae bacterium]|jgi:prephenate dehydrogenase|nr:prephenate dehydrogenase/arogenate dehydrogenase family protein [Anaerolineae bacterium]
MLKTERDTATQKAPHQRVTIVGTGCIGASIGLALRLSQDADHLDIVGHDRDAGHARLAQQMGAFSSTAINLSIALDGAQLVILAVPFAELRETLQDVGRLLDPESNVVVTDTGPLKEPAFAWAAAALPANAHYVGGDPFLAPGKGGWEPLSGVADARGDLFREAVYAIAVRTQDHPSAIRTVANLALVLGAMPLFMDVAEHDAVRLIGATVPALSAAALMRATVNMPGWEEVRRAAGREFATATAGASGDLASARMATLLGRDTVLRGLDAVIAQLEVLRKSVADGDVDGLETLLASAAADRERWMQQSRSRTWQYEQQGIEQDNLFGRTLRSMLGSGIAGRSTR